MTTCNCYHNRIIQAHGAPWHTRECLTAIANEFRAKADEAFNIGHMTNHHIYLQQAKKYETLVKVAKV